MGAPCMRTDPLSPDQFSQGNCTCRKRAGGLQGPAGPSVSTPGAPQLVVHGGWGVDQKGRPHTEPLGRTTEHLLGAGTDPRCPLSRWPSSPEDRAWG